LNDLEVLYEINVHFSQNVRWWQVGRQFKHKSQFLFRRKTRWFHEKARKKTSLINKVKNTFVDKYNLVLWKFEKGKRSSVSWVRNPPAASKQWHDLKVRITGTKVEGYLDGKLYLEHTLPAPVSGRVGLWSKADSYMHFSDYAVTPAN
jgi:hypothetical protein